MIRGKASTVSLMSNSNGNGNLVKPCNSWMIVGTGKCEWNANNVSIQLKLISI